MVTELHGVALQPQPTPIALDGGRLPGLELGFRVTAGSQSATYTAYMLWAGTYRYVLTTLVHGSKPHGLARSLERLVQSLRFIG